MERSPSVALVPPEPGPEYQKLYDVAIKGQTQSGAGEDIFFVAVLSHEKSAVTCVPEDFSWFKLKAVCLHRSFLFLPTIYSWW